MCMYMYMYIYAHAYLCICACTCTHTCMQFAHICGVLDACSVLTPRVYVWVCWGDWAQSFTSWLAPPEHRSIPAYDTMPLRVAPALPAPERRAGTHCWHAARTTKWRHKSPTLKAGAPPRGTLEWCSDRIYSHDTTKRRRSEPPGYKVYLQRKP